MSQNAGLPFLKLVGTGNDFLFLDFRDSPAVPVTALSRSELSARIGHRNTGVGADGIIFVDSIEGSDKLRWDFFNPDGSPAEMCGNALRCMGLWSKLKIGVNEITFLTSRGDVTVSFDGKEFVAELKFINFQETPLLFQSATGTSRANLINTGVPHAVVQVSSIEDRELMAESIAALRFHQDAGERGANVTFMEVIGDRKFKTITYERGVEGYTLSCGTGVLASAAHGLKISGAGTVPVDVEASVETPGGNLKVLFKKHLSAVYLIGPAEVVCTGVIDKRYLQ